MASKWWLLLEKSDETRLSKGIDPYMDETGREYRYDSLVPNHRNISAQDGAVIRKENEILGTCFIDAISRTSGVKTHRRCPDCSSTDVRERTTRTPRFKCGVCKTEFSTPKETQTEVTKYVATLRDFQPLIKPTTVKDVKACAAGGDGENSQHSMIELDASLLAAVLGQALPPILPEPSRAASQSKRAGQGFGLSSEERTAVEQRAMVVTADLYKADGWTLKDTSKTASYDFYATRGNERRFIEVKGTTGTGDSVILTYREVEHARAHREEMALVVVANIALRREDGRLDAIGGQVSTHQHPWTPEDEQLTATEYRYKVFTKASVS